MSNANDRKESSVWANIYSNFKENSENIPHNAGGRHQSPFDVNISQMRGTFMSSSQSSQHSGWLSPYSQEKKECH